MAQGAGELGLGQLEALDLLPDLERDPDGAPVLLHRVVEGLTDPPGGVRREAEAALPVELVHGAHEAERAFLHEIGHVDAAVLVPAGPVHHQPEVGGDHLLARGLVTRHHALGQLDLLLVIGHGELVEVPRHQPQRVRRAHRVFIIAPDAFVAHSRSYVPGRIRDEPDGYNPAGARIIP